MSKQYLVLAHSPVTHQTYVCSSEKNVTVYCPGINDHMHHKFTAQQAHYRAARLKKEWAAAKVSIIEA